MEGPVVFISLHYHKSGGFGNHQVAVEIPRNSSQESLTAYV